MTGHYHVEFWKHHGTIPAFVNPGISPSNGNFPGFRIYTIVKDEKFVITDYEQYRADLNE